MTTTPTTPDATAAPGTTFVTHPIPYGKAEIEQTVRALGAPKKA